MENKIIKNNQKFNSPSTNKLSVRLPDWQKNIVAYCSNEDSLTLTDVVKNSINNYFVQDGKHNSEELKQKTQEKYVQLDLFEWATRNLIAIADQTQEENV
jgi:hypothetical protein